MDAAQHVRTRYPLSGVWPLALLVAATLALVHGSHIPTSQPHNWHVLQIHQGTGSIKEGVHGDGSLEAGAKRQLSELTSKSRVIVVNDIAGHYEVLAGVLHVLNSLNVKPHVLYVGAPNTPVTWGLLGWLGEEPSPEWDQLPLSWPSIRHDSTADGGATGSEAEGQVNHTVVRVLEGKMATWHPMKMIDSLADENLSAELVLCVSAELAPDVCRSVVETVKPHQLVVVLHRADALSLNAKVLTLHKRMDMFALAPHVARMSEFKMRVPVGWALPTAPLVPKRGGCMQLACLDGFTVQGALRRYRNKNGSGYTRNYLQLWARLLDLKQHHVTLAAGGSVPVVRVAVLGKGDRSALGIPPDLEADISFYSRLPYQEFWGRIHRSLALVPSLGHAEYYLSRITSTVLASLITTTPIIADQRFMDVYDFLGPEHVFLRLPEEDEASAMYRIASMPESEVISRRAALQTLRQTLNQRSRTLFGQWLERARF